MTRRPFRFSANVPTTLTPVAAWKDTLAKMEDAGFAAVAIADHFTGGYSLEPMVALTAAAMCSRTLRVQTAVLGNDYRHPVLVHRMAATLDVLSEGRFELGLGAGWMSSDYDAAGLDYDTPGRRIDRLAETIAIVKGLFGDEPFSFVGKSYHVHDLDGVPKPVQRPHPPLLIGGGGKRVLRLAGREADIVGINANLAAGRSAPHRSSTSRRSASRRKCVGRGRAPSARAAPSPPSSWRWRNGSFTSLRRLAKHPKSSRRSVASSASTRRGSSPRPVWS